MKRQKRKIKWKTTLCWKKGIKNFTTLKTFNQNGIREEFRQRFMLVAFMHYELECELLRQNNSDFSFKILYEIKIELNILVHNFFMNFSYISLLDCFKVHD